MWIWVCLSECVDVDMGVVIRVCRCGYGCGYLCVDVDMGVVI